MPRHRSEEELPFAWCDLDTVSARGETRDLLYLKHTKRLADNAPVAVSYPLQGLE